MPSLSELLIDGGDDRLRIAPRHRENRYGCTPFPDPALLDFGSSTASVISEAGFAAAEQLHQRLQQALATTAPEVVYAAELGRLRSTLGELLGISSESGGPGGPGPALIFSPSGTDLHLLAGRLIGADSPRGMLMVMMDPAETGSGVPAAAAGRHFAAHTALGRQVMHGAPLDGAADVATAAVALRLADGTPRPRNEIDAEVDTLVSRAVAAGRRVLLTLLDVSKTGLIAPSPACVAALQQRWPQQVDVLVDACQFRIAPALVRAHLEQRFMVALTGSKFIAGPSFSGVLLVPDTLARQLSRRALPPAMADYSCAAEWPPGWAAASALGATANFGLLLRWEAALAELNAFHRIPEQDIALFLQRFAAAVGTRLAHDPRLVPLAVPPLERNRFSAPLAWDGIQTIFPFLLRRTSTAGGKTTWLDREQTARVHRLLRIDLHAAELSPGIEPRLAALRCHLGQPVACGGRGGVAVSALRLCASARHVVRAVRDGEADRVISQALDALDKAAQLADAA